MKDLFQINLTRYKSKKEGQSLWLIGAPFHGLKLLKADDLLTLLRQSIKDGSLREGELAQIVGTISGFWSFVWRVDANIVVLATDVIRSFPLLYRFEESRLLVRDALSPEDANVAPTDKTSLLELALTGYVTGDRTTLEGWFQLEAGELVVVHLQEQKVRKLVHTAFFPLNEGTSPLNEVQWADRFLEVLLQATKRLVAYAQGRPIVVPLSGGWDSRTIALVLKKVGYEPLIAFSYGKPKNAEAEVSRHVASQLGIPWLFAEYSLSTWREAAQSSWFAEYLWFGHNGYAVPHIQDLLAIRLLKSQIPSDAVVVPGHTGDFLAGGHIIPYLKFTHKISSARAEIWRKHYTLLSPTLIESVFKISFNFIEKALLCRIEEELRYLSRTLHRDSPSALTFYEGWEWRERQAKFIANSVRVYEFFGFDWWMPFWDHDLVDFYNQVPFPLRMNRRLHGRVLESLERALGLTLNQNKGGSELTSEFQPYAKVLYHALRSLPFLGSLIEPLRDQYVRIARRQALVEEYENHPLAWYGLWKKEDYLDFARYATGGENVNSLVALEICKRFYKQAKKMPEQRGRET